MAERRRSSAAHVRSILDNTLDAVIVLDAAGIVTFWNPQAEHTFGVPREGAIGRTLAEVILPEDLPPEVRAENARAPELPAGRMTLDEVKRWYVGAVLDETGGNKLRAAELLGIDRRTLYRILERESEDE